MAADLVLMPLAEPAVVLGGSWLVGEAVAVAVALVPGLVLGRWTAVPRRPGGRAALQVVAFTGLLFFVLPALVFEVAGAGWGPLLDRPRWHLVAAAVVLAPAAATALQAVREFATAGGTPFPLDPPTRLVTTGPYAYVANPMQLGATILLAAWGVLLASPEIVAAAAMGAVFSAGLATWSERADLTARFGDGWHRYRRRVRPWLPRRRPAVTEPGAIHVATTCGPCAEVGRFLATRRTVGLTLTPAEACATPCAASPTTRAGAATGASPPSDGRWSTRTSAGPSPAGSAASPGWSPCSSWSPTPSAATPATYRPSASRSTGRSQRRARYARRADHDRAPAGRWRPLEVGQEPVASRRQRPHGRLDRGRRHRPAGRRGPAAPPRAGRTRPASASWSTVSPSSAAATTRRYGTPTPSTMSRMSATAAARVAGSATFQSSHTAAPRADRRIGHDQRDIEEHDRARDVAVARRQRHLRRRAPKPAAGVRPAASNRRRPWSPAMASARSDHDDAWRRPGLTAGRATGG